MVTWATEVLVSVDSVGTWEIEVSVSISFLDTDEGYFSGNGTFQEMGLLHV